MKLATLLVFVVFHAAPENGGQQPAPNQRPSDPTNPTIIQPAPEREISAPEQPTHRHQEPEWWGPETAPEWFQVGLTVAAGLIAWLAFRSDRNTVRLTQRADVLMDKVIFAPNSMLYQGTEMTFLFKNYGATRASNVRIGGDLVVPGVPKLPVKGVGEMLDAGVIGPSCEQPFTFAPLGTAYPEDVIRKVRKGELEMFVELTVHYTDVFGRKHTTFNRGRYDDLNFTTVEHKAD